MELVEKRACYGCENCKNVCPKKAITMEWDEESFLYPVIDKERCVDCGLCRKTCPAAEPRVRILTHDIVCYGGRYEDIKKVKQSSSGGAASALSERIIEEGGSVYGARYENDFREVVTSRATTKRELEAFKGSKYVQSRKKDIYNKIVQDLKKGLKVLYIGCPCEIAALKSLINMEAEKLYTAELICSGVTSPLYLRDYLAEKAKRNGDQKIIEFTMRDPSQEWKADYAIKVVFSDHEERESLLASDLGDAWGAVKRPCCYRCGYKGNARVADLTLGDFWGVDRDVPEYSEWGNSILLAHTQKGKRLAEELKGFRLFDADLHNAYESNRMMTECCAEDARRNKFVRVYRRKGLAAAAHAILPRNVRIKEAIKKAVPVGALPGILKIWHGIIDKREKGK